MSPFRTQGEAGVLYHARVVHVDEVGNQFKHGAAYVTAVGKSQEYERWPCPARSLKRG